MSSSKTYSADEQHAFLAAVDARLGTDVQIVILGGSAISLEYDHAYWTTDIDTHGADHIRALQTAIAAAHKALGTGLPVHDAGVVYLPRNYKSRLVPILPDLQRLRVFVPEVHDLALSKIARSESKDIKAVRKLNRDYGLDEATLHERFFDELEDAPGSQKNLDYYFKSAIYLLYGEAGRERAIEALRARGR